MHLIALAWVLSLGLLATADIEYASNATLGDKSEQPVALDSAKISMLDDICNKNSQYVWVYLRDRIDLNNDSVINQTELHDFLAKMIKKSHQEDLSVELKDLDKNNTGFINFSDYVSYMFELSVSELEQLDLASPNANNHEVETANKIKYLYIIEKSKWMFISKNKTTLDYEGFYMFKYSSEYPVYHKHEIKTMFENFDKDKDSFLSVREFDEVIQDFDNTLMDPRRKRFSSKIDLNKDNKLSLEEFQLWYMSQIDPDLEAQIGTDLDTIYQCCDDNLDRSLDESETRAHCVPLIKSKLTNFGFDIDLKYFKNKSDSNSQLKDEL